MKPPTAPMLHLLRDMRSGLRLRCQCGQWTLYVPGGGSHHVNARTAMGCLYRHLIHMGTEDIGLYTLTPAGLDALERDR